MTVETIYSVIEYPSMNGVSRAFERTPWSRQNLPHVLRTEGAGSNESTDLRTLSHLSMIYVGSFSTVQESVTLINT